MKNRAPQIFGLAAALAVVIAFAVTGLTGGCHRERRPNVVMVIIDTLPAGHVSSYGYDRSTTPNLDQVAADGIRFNKAVSASPWTLPSIASIMTGAWPSRHRAGIHLDPYTQEDRRLQRMRPDLTTLADLFRDHGYQTVGLFNNPFVHPDTGLDQGFDTYNYAEGDNLTIRAANVTAGEAIQWIEQFGEKPFFMVIHFFDPHLAYNPSLQFAAPYIAHYQGDLNIPFSPDLYAIRRGEVSYSDDDKGFITGLYDAEVIATDGQLGEFLQYLKVKKLYDPALIIITADHGEEFWEHGGFEHGHSLHKEVIEVPLVFKYPGKENAGQVVPDYVSLCDIFPTVAEFMGWPITFPVDGISLLPKAGALHVPAHNIASENVHYGPQQQAFYAENYKLIVNTDTGEIAVFNLTDDPDENNNRLGMDKLPDPIKAQVGKMAKDLEAALASGQSEELKLDQATIEKLKSLGYLSDSPAPAPGDTASGEEKPSDGATAGK